MYIFVESTKSTCTSNYNRLQYFLSRVSISFRVSYFFFRQPSMCTSLRFVFFGHDNRQQFERGSIPIQHSHHRKINSHKISLCRAGLRRPSSSSTLSPLRYLQIALSIFSVLFKSIFRRRVEFRLRSILLNFRAKKRDSKLENVQRNMNFDSKEKRLKMKNDAAKKQDR